ncbi:MAG: ATP-binding protein [Saprospiraceae bacterium]|nr:ATP-binding protein [Saprospiraceae bacterium]
MAGNFTISGPESTGKTYLSMRQATLCKGTWIPEYSRSYLNQLRRSYAPDDLDNIADGQLEMILRAHEQSTGKPLILDTDLLNILVWSELKYGKVSSKIEACYRKQPPTHHLLLQADLPWEFDSLRENPFDRAEIFKYFIKTLQFRQLPFTIIEGFGAKRINQCIWTMIQKSKFL